MHSNENSFKHKKDSKSRTLHIAINRNIGHYSNVYNQDGTLSNLSPVCSLINIYHFFSLDDKYFHNIFLGKI
jgi:hypothetical protein